MSNFSKTNKIKWAIKKYNELNLDELYEILKIRVDIFIIEQECFYQDLDDKDKVSFHLMGIDINTNKMIAYLRILPPSVSYKEPSIGRVVTVKSYRKMKLGKELMFNGIKFIENKYKNQGIRISGQKYLEVFYNNLGFKTVSDVYLEDGIEHVEMFKEGKCYQ